MIGFSCKSVAANNVSLANIVGLLSTENAVSQFNKKLSGSQVESGALPSFCA